MLKEKLCILKESISSSGKHAVSVVKKSVPIIGTAFTFGLLNPTAALASNDTFWTKNNGTSINSNTYVNLNGSMNTQTLVNKVVGMVLKLFMILGIILLIVNVAKLLSAISESNAADQSKATKNIAVAAVLIGFPAIVQALLK